MTEDKESRPKRVVPEGAWEFARQIARELKKAIEEEKGEAEKHESK